MREFKIHLSKYVGKVNSGQAIELTWNRKITARLVGVPSADSIGVARLLLAGLQVGNQYF